ncbi:hypothetical protein QUB80_12850 [Chlorogloeopsis sp. ULAP01]|uniref:hypothetical protein n=1 Tax=Chlorogloeopsis sp. ULAP01 TaxID=3056483 RepID=UPI0025AA6DB7|nr:hypothetical protein [Chlorogloeopsis sp. ULAP01]MDM9381589.1 hypothetical protein [Chlorogloeopsis sp. ULAP01]
MSVRRGDTGIRGAEENNQLLTTVRAGFNNNLSKIAKIHKLTRTRLCYKSAPPTAVALCRETLTFAYPPSASTPVATSRH